MNATSGRIGIFGGSFDPIHIGHLVSAQDACEQLKLASLLFMPTATSPLRDAPHRASAEARLTMIRLALEDDPRFEVSDLEIRRGGVSYTIETVRDFQKTRPSASPVWIIGEDQVGNLPQWRDIEELARLAEFACLRRPGYTGAHAAPDIPRLRLHLVRSHRIEISSTEIRSRIREKRSIRFFLPEPVIDYINTNNLYT